MLIDTHCHVTTMTRLGSGGHTCPADLSHDDYHKVADVVAQASHDDVDILVTIGTNEQESSYCSLLARTFGDIYASVGLFPGECDASWHDEVNAIAELLRDNEKIVAVGECGLDFHYKGYNKDAQIDAFKAQIEMALEHERALIIHTRDAGDEALGIIERYRHELRRAVFHCFSEDESFARCATSWGFFLGITCTVTYPKNEALRAIIRSVGLGAIVLETDAPYLPPHHMRGKPNHPRNVAVIARYLAELLGVPYEHVAEHTTKNALQLFGIDDSRRAQENKKP